MAVKDEEAADPAAGGTGAVTDGSSDGDVEEGIQTSGALELCGTWLGGCFGGIHCGSVMFSEGVSGLRCCSCYLQVRHGKTNIYDTSVYITRHETYKLVRVLLGIFGPLGS